MKVEVRVSWKQLRDAYWDAQGQRLARKMLRERRPREVTIYLVEVTDTRGESRFEAVMLSQQDAARWRDDFNRISGDDRIKATVHPISAAIFSASDKSRSA